MISAQSPNSRDAAGSVTARFARPVTLLLASVALAACGGGSGGGAGAGDAGEGRRAITLSHFQEADLVVGQMDFVGSDANQNGTPAANTLNRPGDSVLADGAFFVVDSKNNRVLGFNALPGINNMNADFVLGQPDFTSSADGGGINDFKRPNGVAIGNETMAVSDPFNYRVLLYNSVATSGSAQPDVVVGGFGCAQDKMGGPGGVEIADNGKLIVTDPSNSRILIWNSLPTQDGQGADLVLGQSDFAHCDENDDDQDGVADATPTARTLQTPRGVWSDGNRLVVADRSNNRVLIWNSFPTVNFQPADLVLGQGDFMHNGRNDDDQDGSVDSEPSNRTFNLPEGIDSNGVQLAISDQINHRVLIWNRFPTTSFAPADVVVGQGDFKHGTANDDDQDGIRDASPTVRTLTSPAGVQFTEGGLLVTDSSNHRVVFYRAQ